VIKETRAENKGHTVNGTTEDNQKEYAVIMNTTSQNTQTL
jgi:hypothetical protein